MSDSIRLVFLGTGAAIPSLRRALPTLAVEFPGETILLDCSEGTQQQLMSAGLSPSRIRHIFISHLHGDHIFGLPGLLTSQHLLARETPLTIWGPAGIAQFLEGIAAVTGHRTRFPLTIHEWRGEDIGEIREERFMFCAKKLDHSKLCYGFRIWANPRPGRFDVEKAHALGIPPGPERHALQMGKRIQLKDGRTVLPEEVVGPERKGPALAYCTDTRPCPAAVALAKEADILLHDSTFDQDLADLARETGHSTAAEAAEVAKQARVKKLCLWHLSGRHDELADRTLLRQAREIFPETVIPEDLSSQSLPFNQET
jgi:ribonuclease Z